MSINLDQLSPPTFKFHTASPTNNFYTLKWNPHSYRGCQKAHQEGRSWFVGKKKTNWAKCYLGPETYPRFTHRQRNHLHRGSVSPLMHSSQSNLWWLCCFATRSLPSRCHSQKITVVWTFNILLECGHTTRYLFWPCQFGSTDLKRNFNIAVWSCHHGKEAWVKVIESTSQPTWEEFPYLWLSARTGWVYSKSGCWATAEEVTLFLCLCSVPTWLSPHAEVH